MPVATKGPFRRAATGEPIVLRAITPQWSSPGRPPPGTADADPERVEMVMAASAATASTVFLRMSKRALTLAPSGSLKRRKPRRSQVDAGSPR
jgi:hypothetical protein